MILLLFSAPSTGAARGDVSTSDYAVGGITAGDALRDSLVWNGGEVWNGGAVWNGSSGGGDVTAGDSL